MKKGFELLKTKQETKTINTEILEKEYNLEIPLLYKVFVNNFSTEENSISYEMFYHPTFKDERYISYCTFSLKPEIDFSGFNSVENSILFSKDIEGKENIDYLTIGHCSVGGILLGIKNDNKDKVYYYNPDSYPDTHLLIANNIFEFIKKLEEIIQPEEYLEGVKYSQLYKNWGDKVWKVRE